MGRLILVPQYPTKLRYQEWWFELFPGSYKPYFDEVITLGSNFVPEDDSSRLENGGFSPVDLAIEFESLQILEYSHLSLKEDDILLLCDLSFPGLFANVLFHKKPKKCFAICHATSKNNYDYFSGVRGIKYPIEKSISKLFDGVFVATQYHKEKLGWDNIHVVKFPHVNPPHYSMMPLCDVVCVSRPGVQKRTKSIEKFLKKNGIHIEFPQPTAWDSYFNYLSFSKVLLITSKEETYGYQVLDALCQNCVPVAPRAYSYPELLPKELLYDSKEECLSIINSILNGELRIDTFELYKNLSKEFKEFFAKTSSIMKQYE